MSKCNYSSLNKNTDSEPINFEAQVLKAGYGVKRTMNTLFSVYINVSLIFPSRYFDGQFLIAKSNKCSLQ